MLYTLSPTFAKLSTVDFDDVINKSKPIFQGINFNQTESDNSSILDQIETYDEKDEIIIMTTEDIPTITPDSLEVIAKSRAIFRRKSSVVNHVTNNVRPDNINMVNLSMTIKPIKQTTTLTTNIVSQPQHMSNSTTSVQTDRTIKSHLATGGATSKSLAKLLSFKKGMNINPLNITIDPDTIYVPRFHIKMNNEIDKTDHNVHNNVFKAVRFKRDIKTISIPGVQYAPVNIAFRRQVSDAQVVSPMPKFSLSYGPVATRTIFKYYPISKVDPKQKKAIKFKLENYNKKLKISEKFNNVLKKNLNSTTENMTTIGKPQNYLKKLYLDVIDLKEPPEVTKTKSDQHDGEKKVRRVKRDLPEVTTESVASIEEPKEITILNVTPKSVTEQTVPNIVIENLNNILTKNLTETVNEVFNEFNMTVLTPTNHKFPGPELLFKVPSKYLYQVSKYLIE